MGLVAIDPATGEPVASSADLPPSKSPLAIQAELASALIDAGMSLPEALQVIDKAGEFAEGDIPAIVAEVAGGDGPPAGGEEVVDERASTLKYGYDRAVREGDINTAQQIAAQAERMGVNLDEVEALFESEPIPDGPLNPTMFGPGPTDSPPDVDRMVPGLRDEIDRGLPSMPDWMKPRENPSDASPAQRLLDWIGDKYSDPETGLNSGSDTDLGLGPAYGGDPRVETAPGDFVTDVTPSTADSGQPKQDEEERHGEVDPLAFDDIPVPGTGTFGDEPIDIGDGIVPDPVIAEPDDGSFTIPAPGGAGTDTAGDGTSQTVTELQQGDVDAGGEGVTEGFRDTGLFPETRGKLLDWMGHDEESGQRLGGSLMRAGGAILSSRAPHWSQALGEGITAGTDEYASLKKAGLDEEAQRQRLNLAQQQMELNRRKDKRDAAADARARSLGIVEGMLKGVTYDENGNVTGYDRKQYEKYNPKDPYHGLTEKQAGVMHIIDRWSTMTDEERQLAKDFLGVKGDATLADLQRLAEQAG